MRESGILELSLLHGEAHACFGDDRHATDYFPNAHLLSVTGFA
ncbi:hypothetical protein V12G01_04431 [Vibrio alginolyticus 12G01]|nr:hypothetical protein V12G01_04431 [Vibrio alginolyticus 12G01]